METKSYRTTGPDGDLTSLNAAINTLDIARDSTSVKPAKDTLGSVSLLLTIRVCSFQLIFSGF